MNRHFRPSRQPDYTNYHNQHLLHHGQQQPYPLPYVQQQYNGYPHVAPYSLPPQYPHYDPRQLYQQQYPPSQHYVPVLPNTRFHQPQSPLLPSRPYQQPQSPLAPPRQFQQLQQSPLHPPSTTPNIAAVPSPSTPVPNHPPSDIDITISPAPVPAPVAQPEQPQPRPQFFPPLPWYSVPGSKFPIRAARRRRRRNAQSSSDKLELPNRPPADMEPHRITAQDPNSLPSASMINESREPCASTSQIASETPARIATHASLQTSPTKIPDQLASSPSSRNKTNSIIPAIPLMTKKHQSTQSLVQPTSPEEVDMTRDTEGQTAVSSDLPAAVVSPAIHPPKSWAELFARGPANGVIASPATNSATVTNGRTLPKTGSLGELLRSYAVNSGNKLCFLEPRGLVNTGNMCYMNSILQVLLYCVPFYDFLDLVGKRAVHSFKSDTPLVEALIMFMREYPVIDSAASTEQLRLRLKDSELEQYGDSFIPEYVYDTINRLPRFSTMRRGHQQDAEEFLGFLLEGLHDECTSVIKAVDTDAQPASKAVSEGGIPPESERSTTFNASTDVGWLEVGPKQKAAVTRSSGMVVTESPVTKIFGGKLRSVLRVPGLKDSVTLEPYQPLQLDIGAPNVYNITDALRGLTRSEILHGQFNSPRGPGTIATKQVFIETLPPVLILHLKRFQYENTGGTQKIWRKIGYPLDLEIPKEVFPLHQRGALTARPGGLPMYRLISVVYHHGKSASGGHYTVDVRRQEGREWIRIDDTVIRRIRAEDVAGEGSEEDPKLLAKALEQQTRNEDTSSSNIYKQAFGNDDDCQDTGEDDGNGSWSQVNGTSSSPIGTTSGAAKKDPIPENGAGGSMSSAATPGRQTPKTSAKFSAKDNKVAYILFYQRIGA